MLIDHGTPIDEALGAMKLSDDDRAAILALSHVRTVGDLAVALERGELPEKLAAKVKKVLG